DYYCGSYRSGGTYMF
nr:immunoglobulin light chain junction region [Macaca mulatta]MOV95202.1 immunoglobulin light chain junction region [Macaca mulatta]MOV96240.1 immunoglobulin light chain junction region [Macaca mulatta]MOV98656.1 immunoglobulin light chain junction region [Macaca mulatta]